MHSHQELNKYSVTNINLDHLIRNFPLKKGRIEYPEEYVLGKGNKKTLRDFKDLPSIIPIQIQQEISLDQSIPKEKQDHSFKYGHNRTENNNLETLLLQHKATQEEIDKKISNKQEQQQFENVNLEGEADVQDLNLRKAEDFRQFREKVEIISHYKIVYTKPIAIIYNPNSGKKRNIRTLIESGLSQAGVPFEFLESLRAFHTFELAEGLDMEKYSALVAVGGDGTFHEVVNGMLHRKDKRKIPVAYIPNGSGNDNLRSYHCYDVQSALDYIIKGDIIKVDTVKVLADAETEEEVPESEKYDRIRYQLINSSFSLPARVNLRAHGWKKCCCNPYQMAALIELCKLRYDLYDIYIDEELVVENTATPMAMGFNGKYGGNGFLLNPMGVINDGLVDMLIVTKKYGAKRIAALMDQALKFGGIHGYNPDILFLRGKTAKIVNKNVVRPGDKDKVNHYVIDGEDVYYKKFVKYECDYQALEVIVDFDYLMTSQNWFVSDEQGQQYK